MRRFLFLLGLTVLPAPLAAGETVDYLRDVKPILKGRCFACHGALKQKAGLRLDTAALDPQGRTPRPGGRAGRMPPTACSSSGSPSPTQSSGCRRRASRSPTSRSPC